MQSKFIIFNTESEAIILNNRVTADLLSTWTDGITNNYCNARKHPTLDKWAVIIEHGYEQYFTESEITSIVELGEDWTPVMITK